MSKTFLFLSIFAVIPALSAGELTGVVYDMFGKPLGGTAIRVENSNKTVSRETATLADGRFNIADLPPGSYIFAFLKRGFREKRLTKEIGEQTTALILSLEYGDLFTDGPRFIRGKLASHDTRHLPAQVMAVAKFDSTVILTASVSKKGVFALRIVIPGEYLVGIIGEPPENATQCHVGGGTNLYVDIAAKTCRASPR